MKNFLRVFLSVQGSMGFLIVTGCATFSKPAKVQPKAITDGAAEPQVVGDSIVMQPGSKIPLISSRDGTYWVSLKAKGKDELARMRGQLATGDWENAITSGKNYLTKHPDHPEAMVGLASAYALGRRYEMAGYYAGQVLKIQPNNSDAMNIVGLRIMMATGNRRADYQDAVSWLQRSIDIDGTQIAAGLNLGHLQLELGLSTPAADAFAATARRCGECNSSLMGLGIASARGGKGEDAKAAFEKILRRDAFHAEAKYQLAMNYRNNLSDRSRAIKLLQEIVSDAEGKYADDLPVKRQANIALRRIKATDRSGEDMKYKSRNVRASSGEEEQVEEAPPTDGDFAE